MKENAETLRFHELAAIFRMLTGLCVLLPTSVMATQTLVISTMSLPDGTVGQAYNAQLNTCLFDTQALPPQCAADTSTSTWSVVSFSLPAGLTLTSSGNKCGPHFWDANGRCDLFVHGPSNKWHIYRPENTLHLHCDTCEYSVRCAHGPCVLVCFHERQ